MSSGLEVLEQLHAYSRGAVYKDDTMGQQVGLGAVESPDVWRSVLRVRRDVIVRALRAAGAVEVHDQPPD